MSNAQGALEYLLLIGGAVLVSVIVITLILGISGSQEDSVTATSQSAFDVIRAARERIVESSEIVLFSDLSFNCESNKYAGVGVVVPDNLDVSAFEESDSTLGNVHLVGEIILDNASICYPRRFEYTKFNNIQGFILSIPIPAGGWKTGSNTIDIPIVATDYTFPEITPWDNMDRVENYINVANLIEPSVIINFKNMRLVKIE